MTRHTDADAVRRGSTALATGRDGHRGPGAATPVFRRSVLALRVSAVVVLLVSAISLVRECLGPSPVSPYVAPLYWLGYDQGFVRRGLPGALARLLAGGQDPSLVQAMVVGVGLSVLAVLAVVLLALALAGCAGSRPAAVAVAAAVLASPLGLSLYVRDLGRPDAVGVVVLVLVATVPWRRLPAAATVLGVALLTSSAVAAEELLVAFVLPVGLLALRTAWAGRLHRTLGTVVALAPALLVAVASVVVPVPAALLDQATATARAVGVLPSVPIVPGQGDHDAVSRLKYGFAENAQTYYSLTTPEGVVAATLLCAALYLLVLGLVWRLLGRSTRERSFRLLAGSGALAALALSVAGIDYRRWWALAAVTALTLTLQLTAGRAKRAVTVDRGLVVALVALAVAGALLQTMPLWPVRSLAELGARVLG